MGGSVSYSSSLRNCAMVCSLKRAKRKCKNKFGSFQCNNCKWDINQYADIDPRQAKLFVMQTDFEAKDTIAYNRTADIVFWFFILGFLFLGLRSFNHYHPGELQKYVPEYFQKPAVVYQVIEAQEGPKYKDKRKVIEDTLFEVAVLMVLETDVDGDGLINCHDSSCLFYMNYPWKDEVRFIMNKNEPSMNHLFVAVILDGKWVNIEPWMKSFSGKQSYLMEDVWGSKYNPKYNKDVTNDVKKLGWVK